MPSFPLHRRRFLSSSAGALVAAGLPAASERQSVRITVDSARMQRFDGFGLSQPDHDTAFAALPPAVQAKGLDFVYRDLPVDYFRAWVHSDSRADAAAMLAEFRRSYLDNAMLAKIAERCRPKLILAPGTGGEGPSSDPADYAQKIAELLESLRDQEGLLFEATGIINEPLQFPTSYLAAAASHLRAELDRRNLHNTKVIAADWANVDYKSIAALAELETNRGADASIYAWCNHSYRMASTLKMAVAARNKQRWVTEAGQVIPDTAGTPAAVNAMDGADLAGRFLTDLNLGASRWIYFIGLLSSIFHKDPKNPWSALALISPNGEITAFNRYFVLKQLLNAFPRGSVLHACRSSLDGSMDWTYGQKPRLSAACATGFDERLRLAAVNATGIVGDTVSRYYRAQSLRLELDLPWQKKAFDGFVIGPDGRTRPIGAVVAGIGKTGPTLQPFEIAVLVERAS